MYSSNICLFLFIVHFNGFRHGSLALLRNISQ
jgi:hypothetical protein